MRRSTRTLNFEHNAHPKSTMTAGPKPLNVVWQKIGGERPLWVQKADLRSIRNDATTASPPLLILLSLHRTVAADHYGQAFVSRSPSLRPSHSVVGAWIRIVIRMAMKVTDAITCAPGAFMPSSRPASAAGRARCRLKRFP